MQFDAELLSVGLSVCASIFVSGIKNGSLKTKVETLEKVVDSLIKKMDCDFVPLDLFNATVNPIKEDLQEMKTDVKQILNQVTRIECPYSKPFDGRD